MHLLHTDKWGEDGLKFTMLVAFLDLMLEKSKATGKRYVVMLIDAFDTLLQAKPDDILQRYLKSGNDVIVSGEASCFAGPWDFPLCNLNAKPCELFEHGERRWPSTSGIIGDARALQEVFREVKVMPKHMLKNWPGSEPGLLGQLYLTRRVPGMAVDRDSSFFGNFHPPLLKKDDGAWSVGGLPDTQAARKNRPAPAALHFGRLGARCFRTIEATAWYNKGRPEASETGSGTCTHNSMNTWVYEYEPELGTFAQPQEHVGFYENKCREHSCTCEKDCECSHGQLSVDHCSEYDSSWFASGLDR